MICHRCLQAAAAAARSCIIPNDRASRFFSTTLLRTSSATTTAARRPAPSTSSHQPSAATSTSAAQPFSTPLTPSPRAAAAAATTKPSSPAVTVVSSVPAGTPLRGLNFLKNQGDPVAMEDSEYPAWLWEVLRQEGKKAEEKAEGDLFSKSKKQRRLAAKRLRRQALLNPDSLTPKVPVYEQSVDLPSGNGTTQGAVEAEQAREELRKAMRVKRRSTIKEANFLKAMG